MILSPEVVSGCTISLQNYHMIKIVKTNDKILPRKQDGWRNSTSVVTGGMIPNVKSNVNDAEIDMISDQLDSQAKQPCNKSIQITDVKQFEINKYINNFIKQNGNIIDDNHTAKNDSKKVLLG
jgi:starvation-inducible outer membrane lipoprotein